MNAEEFLKKSNFLLIQSLLKMSQELHTMKVCLLFLSILAGITVCVFSDIDRYIVHHLGMISTLVTPPSQLIVFSPASRTGKAEVEIALFLFNASL